jgi:transcriptional regulator with XRE-family HTH domain
MLFSERLAELRAAAKLSQTELAARAMVVLATVKDYEGGRRSPSLELAQRLAGALGVTMVAFDGCRFTNAGKKTGATQAQG